jgi:multimeric flavodoxin WrbA
MELSETQKDLCTSSRWDFSDLNALYLNCTLKKTPEASRTEGLMRISQAIMEANRVQTEMLRPVDYQIALGIHPDMTRRGWERDDWHRVFSKVRAADILVLGTSVWMGEKTSVCQMIIERLYGMMGELNEHGQYAYYGKVGGCLATGNEDGIRHCAMGILYSLQHIGYLIPPQADAGCVGGESEGPGSDVAICKTAFMTWNLMHMARMLRETGGIPSHGNQPSARDGGCGAGFSSPGHR